ncbi:DUF6735 family protein [Haloarcula nitratireducens]|uniref:Uncharacterized protein n=1 Tax=Haloarcula nitratireducens TaxID=2487749 RepID=A0AAW4PC77_9EURY|nr:DUF6735 family protein [Halomicroarcula nitratireducens]MBX0295316.1 hypothetical protein [Halomicroarcula nitratireducens]
MGRRTLVAVARADGRFDCRYAHWGVDADPIAQSEPLGTGWPAAAVRARLDAGFDQLLVCDGTVRRYCVCWLDPTLTDPEDVALARTDDPAALREWWVEVKGRACEVVGDGIDARTVRDGLLAALRLRADVAFPPDDASFLRTDR